MGGTAELEHGRTAYAARAWADTVEALSAADADGALDPGDLELLARALFMIGREQEHYAIFERAHHAHLDAGCPRPAALCAFWIGMQLFIRGEVGRGGGWLGRASRLLEDEGDCVEKGYLLMPEAFRKEAAGDLDGAIAIAASAADAGRRFGDADLFALATHAQGEFLISEGRLPEGLGLVDEAMLAVTGGEVSPMPSGIIYCGAIGDCRTAFDPRRAREWTDALHAWCETQPDLLAFTGDCHVHRAEIMELRGRWSEALEELGRAAQRAERAGNRRVAGQAAYHRGEILRLRGALVDAEDAYRESAQGGWEPQPGLALLRLAQGDVAAARATIRRVLEETTAPPRRAALLPACVEIMLAGRDREDARAACDELEQIAAGRASDMLAAMAAHAHGAVELADGNTRAALPALRSALDGWNDIGAPYEAARVRLQIAEACQALGDADSAALERDAARRALDAVGAALDTGRPEDAHGLTARELEVLRLVAGGATNKAIAAELVLSERTVDRHVSNILAKLRVSSRSGATAYAYEHRLL